MGFKLIFSKIKEAMQTADISNVKGFLAVEVTLTGLGGGVFYVEIKDGVLSVEPYNYADKSAGLTLSVPDFKKFADGNLKPEEALGDGRLKIEGSVEKALEFYEIVKTLKR